MTINTTKCAVAAVAVLLGLAGPTALADECDAMTGGVKVLIDKMDPAAKGGNNPAKLCAAFGEGLGMIKSFRVVVDECLDEGPKRTEVLAGLDRSIRQLQGHLDNNCQ
jgi:hypothetical protein